MLTAWLLSHLILLLGFLLALPVIAQMIRQRRSPARSLAWLLVYSRPEILEIQDWIEDLARGCRPGVEEVGSLRDIHEGVARMMAPML